MNALILADTCTWKSKGTETARVAQWTDTTIPCQWEPRHGAYRSTSGDLSEYSLEVITTTQGIQQHDMLAKGSEEFSVVYVDDIYFRGAYHHSEVYAK